MSFDFNKALKVVLQYEGGYVNDTKDPGGETKYGISKRSYPHLDIKSLSLKDVEPIYRKDYWQVCACDQMPWPVSMVVFDTAVNMGVKTAAQILQEVVGAKADGVIGPKTITKVMDSVWPNIIIDFTTQRIIRYTKTKNWDVYGKGWTRRAISISMAASAFMEGR